MTDKQKILVVEDEEALAFGIEFNLMQEGYSVTIAKDGKEAVELINANTFDLFILDIMLPYLDGFEIAQYIREKDPQIPILILTARTKKEDKIKGLEIGVDDYLTKPFHLEELLLRIQGMLKRKSWYREILTENPEYKFGKNTLNFSTFECSHGNRQFRMTTQEAITMKYFIENKGMIITRKELLENVWKINPDVETRTVDNFIVRLRKLFENDPSEPVYIKSIRSAGYMFSEDKN
jgi:DNA-binding response OmpR family regulator